MSKTVDRNSSVPVRIQIKDILLSDIREGVFPPDRRMPSERALAERYKASRASVREAIAELTNEGILYRVGSRGTCVARLGAVRIRSTAAAKQIGFWISEEVFHFVQAGYTRILTGAEEMCRASGFSLRFYSVNEQKQSLDLLFSSGSDVSHLAGHVIAGGVHQPVLERLRNLGAPLAVVDPLLAQPPGDLDSVQIDYGSGTREAVKHLAELGHRRIGFIGFPGSIKYEAFWRALEEFGVPYSPRFVQFLQMPDLAPSVLAGYQCASRLLTGDLRPTALVVSNDYIAMGALDAIFAAGLSVPEDISLIGFDDLGQTRIPMTTVRVDLVGAGRMAVQMLLDRIATPSAPVRGELLPVELIVRGTTAPPKEIAP